jgi:RNA polymerase sigma factor (sigma-70 family)
MTDLERTATSADLGALVQAARTGNQDAFAELYGRLSPGVFDYLAVLTGDRASAEDLLQQTFLDAWQSLASLQDPAKVRQWVYALARHVGQDHLRSRDTTVPLEEARDPEAGDPGPEDVAISDDATRLVWSAAASLEPQHREALNLSIRHGLTYREIADVLGLRAARAHDLLIRSREALGRAVQLLLVARSSASCPDLRVLAPPRTGPLTVEQRRAVDHHLRLCPNCRALAFQLTRPEELFGAIVLGPLPASAIHAPTIPSAAVGPARLAAAHSAGAGSGAPPAHPWLRRRRWAAVNRHALMPGSVAVALAVAGISVATIRPWAPPPATSSGAASQLDDATLWGEAIQDLGGLHSYTVSYSSTVAASDVVAFDLSVGPTGSWFGTATSVDAPGVPITLADLDGHYYLRGNANLVSVASDYFLTTAQAKALGDGWLDVSEAGGEDSVMSGLLDMAADPSVTVDELLPATLSYGSTVSRTRTTLDGQPVYQLSADGETLDVTIGATPYLLRAASGSESIEFGHLNEKVTWPDVSGALTYQQLTGSPSP